MAADPEILLTVNGVDVTPYIWSWSTLRLSDAWNVHPTLQVELRADFTQAAGLSVPAYADVRMVNLLTGAVLHEGVQATDMEPRTSDPHWITYPVSSTGHQSLLDTSPMQTAYTVPDTLAGAAVSPDVRPVISDILARSFADYRVNMRPWLYPYSGGYPYLQWAPPASAATVFAAGSSSAAAIATVVGYSQPWDGASGYAGFNGEYRAKVFPGYGLVVARPSDAFRGASSAVLTGSARPASISQARNDGSRASGVLETWSSGSRVLKDAVNGTANTNGYLVTRGSYDMAWMEPFADPSVFDSNISRWTMANAGAPYASTSGGYTFRTAEIPDDILVGHSVTFDHPFWGSVTATVQAVTTQFVDGRFDLASSGLPYFLDAGRSLDGTWSLDATATSGVQRRRRVHTVTVADVRRTFVGAARAYGLGIHG